MFRTVLARFSARAVNSFFTQSINKNVSAGLMQERKSVSAVNFSSLTQNNKIYIRPQGLPLGITNKYFLQPTIPSQEQLRTVIKFSWKKGKRKTVKTVLSRFYRLNCGNWIRTIAGRFRKSWKKNRKRRRRHQQHVFCNSTQSRMLDKMVSAYWRKPKFYIKSPYEPYEWRENYMYTRTKPWRPEGVDYE